MIKHEVILIDVLTKGQAIWILAVVLALGSNSIFFKKWIDPIVISPSVAISTKYNTKHLLGRENFLQKLNGEMTGHSMERTPSLTDELGCGCTPKCRSYRAVQEIICDYLSTMAAR